MSGAPDSIWGAPYTEVELDAAQARFGFLFPPDLRALLLEHRLSGALDWTLDHDRLAERFAWPYEGLLFDVENNGLWRAEWGSLPDDATERAAVLRRVVDAAPKLIPVLGHRYIPETPHETDNPVFSVYQSDIVVYGVNLAHYLHEEFHRGEDFAHADLPRLRTIPFWSEMLE
jgi:hypothetical protein